MILKAQQNMWVNLLLLIHSIPALPMQIVSLIKLNRTNYEDWVRSFLNLNVLIIIVKLHKFLMLSLLTLLCMFKFAHVLILFLLLMCLDDTWAYSHRVYNCRSLN